MIDEDAPCCGGRGGCHVLLGAADRGGHPGRAGLNKGGIAQIAAVSCASVSHCGAGGFNVDNSGRLQAFVVSET